MVSFSFLLHRRTLINTSAFCKAPLTSFQKQWFCVTQYILKVAAGFNCLGSGGSLLLFFSQYNSQSGILLDSFFKGLSASLRLWLNGKGMRAKGLLSHFCHRRLFQNRENVFLAERWCLRVTAELARTQLSRVAGLSMAWRSGQSYSDAILILHDLYDSMFCPVYFLKPFAQMAGFQFLY